jgi:hypothetical protein
MIDRLEGLPPLVYDAGWDLVAVNRLGTALVGDTAEFSDRDLNLVWRQFNGDPEVGPVTVDRDILKVQGADLRLIVYSTAPDTPDVGALARLGELVLGGVPG